MFPAGTTPQYRLAVNESGVFPAAFQDPITAFQYLLDLRIPSTRIILSGDSAGGSLAIALLRYIADTKDLLPGPTACFLFAPWLDIASSLDLAKMNSIPNVQTDNIPTNFIVCGAQSYIPPTVSPSDPYISPLRHPFQSKTPIWIQSGRLETLYEDS
jgi:acetyl esterase/lipase